MSFTDYTIKEIQDLAGSIHLEDYRLRDDVSNDLMGEMERLDSVGDDDADITLMNLTPRDRRTAKLHIRSLVYAYQLNRIDEGNSQLGIGMLAFDLGMRFGVALNNIGRHPWMEK